MARKTSSGAGGAKPKRARQRSGGGGGERVESGAGGKGSASGKKLQSYEDTIPDEGVEKFMHDRDMISLNDDQDRRRHGQDDDDEDYLTGQGEEVFGLNLPQDDDDEDDYQEGEEEEAAPTRKTKTRTKKPKPDDSLRGRFGKALSSSDEDGEGGEGSSSGDDIDAQAWGKAYHSRPSTRRGREEDETDDEEREEDRKLEEEEVRRLQRKGREVVKGDEDWGLDDVEEDEEELVPSLETSSIKSSSTESPSTLSSTSLSLPSTLPASKLIAHLSSTSPLTLALARDFSLVVYKLRKTERGMKRLQAEKEALEGKGKGKGEEGEEQGELHAGLGWLHYQTLLSYATTLAFYLHLASLPLETRPDFSTHPVLPRLAQLKEGLTMLEDLDFDAASVDEEDMIELYDGEEDSEDDDEDEEDVEGMELEMEALKKEIMREMKGERKMKRQMVGKMVGGGEDDEDDEDEDDDWVADGTLEDGELDGLMDDAEDDLEGSSDDYDDEEFDFDNDDDLEDEDEEDELAESTAPVTTKGKKSKYAILEEPEFIPTKTSKKSKRSAVMEDSDLLDDHGDPLSLNTADASDKATKKRSLRFHTSKIAQTSARRERARMERLGGDEDLPYKSKSAARDAVLRRNSAAVGEGEDLEDGVVEELENVRKGGKRRRGDDEEEAGEDYYESVKKARKEGKDRSKEEHDSAVAAEKRERDGDVDEKADGPRALTRSIIKNRGLTPHRAKASRNPRVKQKIRYEKAKRKVSSQRAVYKGGQGAQSGSYSGEQSGISQASKSRRF